MPTPHRNLFLVATAPLSVVALSSSWLSSSGCDVTVGIEEAVFACDSDDDCDSAWACVPDSALGGRQVCKLRDGAEPPHPPGSVCELVDWECDFGECSDEDICLDSESERVWVPAGSLAMGCNAALDTACDSDESPQHHVALDAFVIDKYEVTIANYGICVDSGGCTAVDGGCAAAVGNTSDQAPATCVTWSQARTFCQLHGGDLCSEAQWELAARRPCELLEGDCPSAMPIFPWGNDEPTCDLAIHAQGGPGCGQGHPAEVGSAVDGRSIYGPRDMSGNAREWVLDCYHPSFDGAPEDGSPWDQACADAAQRVLKGGSFTSPAAELRSSGRDPAPQDTTAEGIGFRCCGPVP